MHDMIPGSAPEPKTLLLPSLGIVDRLRRPSLDHMLLATLQACIFLYGVFRCSTKCKMQVGWNAADFCLKKPNVL